MEAWCITWCLPGTAHHTMPWHTISCHVVPDQTVPGHTTQHVTVLDHVEKADYKGLCPSSVPHIICVRRFFLANYLTLPSLFSFIFQTVLLTSGISGSEHRDHELTQSTLQLVPSTWKESGRVWGGGIHVFVSPLFCFAYFFCLFLEELNFATFVVFKFYFPFFGLV